MPRLRSCSVVLLVLCLAALARAQPAALPPPIALGGECSLLASCPWSGPSGAHLRLGAQVWMGQPGDPRALSLLPSLALSGSLARWAEAGALFTTRAGAPEGGGPALLQQPITLWARL